MRLCSCSSRRSSLRARWRWRGTVSRSLLSQSCGPSQKRRCTGVQQTVLSVGGVAAPLAFAASSLRPPGASRSGWRPVPAGGLARSPLVPGAGDRRAAPPAVVRSAGADPRATRPAGRARRPDRLFAGGGRRARARERLVPRGGARGRGRRGRKSDRADPGRRRQVWTGSHLDTVPGAGRFDGTLGVVAGLEAVEALGPPGLGVVVFRDEERGCAGSRGCTARPDAYVELHIEQGPTLLRADAPLGVVTAIVGYVRGRRTFDRHAPATRARRRWTCARTRSSRRPSSSSTRGTPPAGSRVPSRPSARWRSSRAGRT